MVRALPSLKVVAVLVLVVVLGAGTALVALKAFFPEPKIRAWVVGAARKQLGREVRLAGIGVGLTGLRLRGLEISERPDFAAGTFLSVESFALRPSWRALAKRRLVVASTAADGLKIRIIKAVDGSFNYETLAAATATAAPAAAAAAASSEGTSLEFNVRRLRVMRGTVEYRDEAGKAVWALSDLALRLDDFSLTDPFDVDVSFRVRGKAGEQPVDATLALAVTIHPARGHRETFSAEIARLSVVTHGLKLLLKGRVAGLDAPEAVLDAALTLAGKTLIEAAGTVRVLSAGGSPGARAVDADFKLQTPGFDTTWLAGLLPEAAIPALTLPAADAAVVGRWDGASASLKTLRLSWAGGKMEGSGAARGLGAKTPVYEGQVRFGFALPAFKVSELPFAASSLPASLVVPAARVGGSARVRGNDLTLETIVITGRSGTLRLGGVVAKALTGTPEPALDIVADLNLPALTDVDLPFAGVPAGLHLPPSRWEADLTYAPRAVRLRKFGVKIEGSEFSVEGGVSDPAGRAAFDLLLKSKRFVLDELTRLTPQTRDLKLSGSGFFALSVTGNKEKPVFGGKLQFKGLGATVADLLLSDFTGTVSFDERRIDVPNLKGKLGDGALTMDLTIKDYGRLPEVQIEAGLDRFDLGKYLAAKNKLTQDAQAANAGKGAAKPAAEVKPATPLRTRGRVEIGALRHPNATVEQASASWDLYGVTPDMRKLSGEAKLRVGGGKLHAIGDMAKSSPVVKVLIFPILIFQKIGRVGGIRLFPDFNDITLRKIIGDYAFKDGVMTLRQSEMDSDAASVTASGVINLPAETLDLLVTAQVANVAPIDVAVTGTVASPKTKVNVVKFIAAPAKQLIEGLLKR